MTPVREHRRNYNDLLLLDVALILGVRPGDLHSTLLSAGYRYRHHSDALSFRDAEQILQRFEAGSLQRPRPRDPVGGALTSKQMSALHANLKADADTQSRRQQLRAARRLSRKKREVKDEVVGRELLEERRMRQAFRAAELRKRPPVWDETYAERKGSTSSSQPAVGFGVPVEGISRVVSAGAPGLGRRP